MAAAAATTLAGCDSGSSGDAGGCTLSVPTLVLCTWNLLCMLYSWWMLRARPWHDMIYLEKPPVTALAPAEPQTAEDTQPALEGLVTLTLKKWCWNVMEEHKGIRTLALKDVQGKRWLSGPSAWLKLRKSQDAGVTQR